ncbi:glycosyltransferase [Methanosarcina mazei]|nr:glycosyltransferase [Methanosarcina mazei]
MEVSNYFKPSWETGGVTKVNYELSRGLIEKGHEVTVYTTDGYASRLDVPKNKPVCVDGIRVYYFYNLFRSLVKKMKFPTPYYAPFVLRGEIRNFDIIHIHEHRTLLAAFVRYYAKKYDVPYVVQAHGSVLPSFQKQKFKHMFDFFFGNQILKDATNLIALSESEVSQYEKMGIKKENVKIVSNGIKIDEFKNLPLRGTFRKKFSIGVSDNLILYVGRIHESKGLDLVLRSFVNILKEEPNSKLVFLGPDNGFLNHLRLLAKTLCLNDSAVIFTGFATKEEKIAALLDSDVFVTPTFTGFPISFLEACFFGLPIVTTNKGDSLDWIHEQVGYVVEYDSNTFANATLTILKNKHLKDEFSIKAKNLVACEFSLDSFIKNIETIYINIKNWLQASKRLFSSNH